jgi:hypothetical protein
MPPKKTRITHRDAGTGQYVSGDYAEKHPKTTVKETNKVVTQKKPTSKKK